MSAGAPVARSASKGAGVLFLLDTSCVVALLCPWQASHARTTAAVTERLDRGAALLLAAPALAEAYAVLTRMPAPFRLSPADAVGLLRANFGRTKTVALGASDYWRLLGRAPAESIAGGRTYDALIAACARKGRAVELLTLNQRHFEQFAGEGLRVVDPAGGAEE